MRQGSFQKAETLVRRVGCCRREDHEALHEGGGGGGGRHHHGTSPKECSEGQGGRAGFEGTEDCLCV